MKNILLIFFSLYTISFFGQVSTNPQLPIDNQAVTITFDATQGTAGLKDYTGDIYAHTGVITDKSSSSSDWRYVIADWNTNIDKAKVTRISTNIYELEISPDIRSFYGVPNGEKILQLAFVFRSGDWTKEGKATGGKDIFVTIYEEGLNVSISSPERINVFNPGETISLTAVSSQTADLSITLNDIELYSENNINLNYSFSIDNPGSYWLKVTATENTVSDQDSIYICIKNPQGSQTMPENWQNGITYLDNQSVALVLYAPGKQHIFVVGDFNNWLPDNNFQMKKDGEHFWIEIENLVPQQEYIYQYLIDGILQIGDPYAEKIVDPYDDGYITNDVYPNLIPYPAGKAIDRASVLQTNQQEYSWKLVDYPIPTVEKLSIYELLIRDFTEEGTYNAVKDKIEYLKQLGINTIELMPFSEFEGNSSWGYNPNFYFAPDKAYGTKNDLKGLIDECHKQGLIVIQDIVLNHAYNSCPLVKMYWDNDQNRPAADNPWFNSVSPNSSYSWGSDFNHESEATKAFVDQVTNFWLTHYNVDGFRFDFTKGFTNTPGDGGAYDASRIAILERMADKIWEVKPEAIIILEHFAANQEEIELTSYKKGMLVWGNANGSFSEASMGYHDDNKSNFSWASWQERGFEKPGLVAYMESHDEERQMYRNLNFGNSSGNYSVKNPDTALDRSELATTFFLSLTGPKMIWQFGELGFDISIDYNGRVGEKPVRWEYFEIPSRKQLFNVYSGMLKLRQQYDVFTRGTETLDVSSSLKKIQLELNEHNITVIGNFGLTEDIISPTFQHDGNWYEFFSGDTLTVTNTSAYLNLAAGEYRLYSDQPLPDFDELVTAQNEFTEKPHIHIFPNPVSDYLNVQSEKKILKTEVISLNGKIMFSSKKEYFRNKVNLNNLEPGIYFLRIFTSRQFMTQKIVLR